MKCITEKSCALVVDCDIYAHVCKDVDHMLTWLYEFYPQI